MLRRYNSQRSFKDNLRLGIFASIIAGMVNVASLVLFFSFTSNITGHFAILSVEIANGKWFQILVVLFWIALFFMGSFISNFIIIHSNKKNVFWSHSIPMLLEIACFLVVGIYGVYYYQETLRESEFLVSLLLFSMGLQNGLTSSISNFTLKTTHLTGITTDLAIHFSLLTKKEFRQKKEVTDKTKLMLAVVISYLVGGIFSGFIIHHFEFQVFYYISAVMIGVLIVDYSILYVPIRLKLHKRTVNQKMQQTV